MILYQVGDIVALTPEANRLKVINETDSDGDLTVKIANSEAWVTPDMITFVSRPETLEQKLARIEAENAIMRKGLKHLSSEAKNESIRLHANAVLASANAVAVKLAT
jgi:hypothetical protein